MFEPGKFDMIFIDYLMPEMKGDKLAAAIKERCPKQPVVMLTAFLEKFLSADCPLAGVDSFIGKPFALEPPRSDRPLCARLKPGLTAKAPGTPRWGASPSILRSSYCEGRARSRYGGWTQFADEDLAFLATWRLNQVDCCFNQQ